MKLIDMNSSGHFDLDLDHTWIECSPNVAFFYGTLSTSLHRYGYPMEVWGHFNLVDHNWIDLGMSCSPSTSSTCPNHIWYVLLLYFVCVWFFTHSTFSSARFSSFWQKNKRKILLNANIYSICISRWAKNIRRKDKNITQICLYVVLTSPSSHDCSLGLKKR